MENYSSRLLFFKKTWLIVFLCRKMEYIGIQLLLLLVTSTKLATIPRGHRELGKHAVVIVGVNEEEEYFIIRNSWGTDWGDEGYGRVAYSAFSSYFHCPELGICA